MELKMLNKQQRKSNNKKLQESIAKQLVKCRFDKKIMLNDFKELYGIYPNILDKAELGIRSLNMQELQYIAAIYDKKIEINLID